MSDDEDLVRTAWISVNETRTRPGLILRPQMTEREYVETIRKAAHGYLANIDAGDRKITAELWDAMKSHLSPHTAIELCEAWMEKQDKLVQTDG